MTRELNARLLLTPGEVQRIDAAVAAAEKKTAGEIVPVLAGLSGNYDRGLFLACTTGTAAVSVALLASTMILPNVKIPLEGPVFLGMFLVVQLLAMAAIYQLARAIPSIWRGFVPRKVMQREVAAAARRAFLEERVTSTRDATGIMIYVSLFEHMVLVLPDRAIAGKFPQETWHQIRDALLAGLRDGKPADGFVAAIERCGEILAPQFPIKPDDVDELPNHLRIID